MRVTVRTPAHPLPLAAESMRRSESFPTQFASPPPLPWQSSGKLVWPPLFPSPPFPLTQSTLPCLLKGGARAHELPTRHHPQVYHLRKVPRIRASHRHSGRARGRRRRRRRRRRRGSCELLARSPGAAEMPAHGRGAARSGDELLRPRWRRGAGAAARGLHRATDAIYA
jgi:hypothetical protein